MVKAMYRAIIKTCIQILDGLLFVTDETKLKISIVISNKPMIRAIRNQFLFFTMWALI